MLCDSTWTSLDVRVVHFFILGFWAAVLFVAVIFPVAYWLPGDDHGSYEDPFSTWNMLMSSTDIQIAFVINFISVIW